MCTLPTWPLPCRLSQKRTVPSVEPVTSAAKSSAQKKGGTGRDDCCSAGDGGGSGVLGEQQEVRQQTRRLAADPAGPATALEQAGFSQAVLCIASVLHTSGF